VAVVVGSLAPAGNIISSSPELKYNSTAFMLYMFSLEGEACTVVAGAVFTSHRPAIAFAPAFARHC